ncbi:DUF559 domain-containing protein [Micromonospora sp. CPCC 206061]|uniref:DUF559 domain-containing protein n=1 Tax=Micromonospora sp. CPCC 206061 TaxID=3122410 RepID=UPI002FF1BB7E
MTDLYDDAAALPRLLRGGLAAHDIRALRGAGISRSAAAWARSKGRLGRPFHATYLSGPGAADLLDRLRAALLALPPDAVFAGQTAALLYGFGVIATNDVHVAVPAGTAVPQRRGVVAHECALPFDDVCEVFGVPCLAPARCAVDLARCLPRGDALAVFDAALRAGACSADELAAEVGRHGRLRGVRQARELVSLATPLSECRQESHLRLVFHDGGLPRPRPQLAVVDEWGVERCRLDLGYEQSRVGAEYDGRSHVERWRLRHDRERHNWLEMRGWRMRYFTDHDLYQRPDRIVSVMRTTLHHPGARPHRWV